MANFKTHYQVGVSASMVGSGAIVLAGIPQASPFFMLPLLFLVGTAGSIMPDIDSDNSTPIRIMTRIIDSLAIILVLYAVYMQNIYVQHMQNFIYQLLPNQWASIIATAILLLLGILALINYVLLPAFKKWTVHRGIFHSLLAAALFGVIFTALSWQLLKVTPYDAWLIGAFMSFGYIVHLSLDEIYAVDFEGNRLKRSFGTALKITDFKQMDRTILFIIAIFLIVVFLTPVA